MNYFLIALIASLVVLFLIFVQSGFGAFFAAAAVGVGMYYYGTSKSSKCETCNS